MITELEDEVKPKRVVIATTAVARSANKRTATRTSIAKKVGSNQEKDKDRNQEN